MSSSTKGKLLTGNYLRSLERLGFTISFNYTGYSVRFNNKTISEDPEYRTGALGRAQGPSEKIIYRRSLQKAIRACHRYIEDHLV